MKRIFTAVITAIEAGAVALAGLALVAIPAMLLWAVTFQLASEPAELAAVVSGVWLLAHAVPLGVAIDAQTALTLGLPPEALTFTLSLAPLGLALVAAGFGGRIGWRLGRRGGAGAIGLPAGVLGFAAMALLPASLAGSLITAPLWIAVLRPTLFFAVPAVIGFVSRAVQDDHEWWHRWLRALSRGVTRLGWHRPQDGLAVIAGALRLAGATLAVLLALAALGVGVSLLGGYAQVVALSQQLQLDPLGAVIMFLAQLALLPIGVLWSLSWLIGSGFAIGVGTSVTPFETLLGPIPALPMLGAIPQSWGSFGPVAMLIIVLGAIGCGVAFARARTSRGTVHEAVVLVLAAAFVGLAVSGLSALAGGSMGPQRLETTGPEVWATGGFAAAEVLVGLVLGTVAARIDVTRNIARAKALAEAGGQRVRGALPIRGTVGETPPEALGGPTPDESKPAEPEAETGDADAEAALVRAYAWDQTTVQDPERTSKTKAIARHLWWRRPNG